MKRFSVSILGVCFGAAGFVLRLLQNRTGFEPDTGLPIPGNVPALALPALLVLAAVVLYLFACRTLPQKAEELFETRFRLGDKGGLAAVLAGSCIMAASGVLDLMEAVGGSAAAVSADGMEVVAAGTGTGGSGVAIGVLSVVSGVCLAVGTILCRRENTQPLIFMAVPVCLLARLILVYRLRSPDPVLGDYYLEILGLMFLILATYRLSGFAVQAGRPRIFTLYGEAAVVLALTMLPDGVSPAVLLMLGGALALTGFQMMLEPGPASQPSEENT